MKVSIDIPPPEPVVTLTLTRREFLILADAISYADDRIPYDEYPTTLSHRDADYTYNELSELRSGLHTTAEDVE